jgi:hypothetical protein
MLDANERMAGSALERTPISIVGVRRMSTLLLATIGVPHGFLILHRLPAMKGEQWS